MHVVTVNDYLAKRDAEWMGQIYNFLGLTVGVIVHGLDDDERKAAYACDVTYGTNNELGFDYLRDNMKYRLEDMVQRGHVYAIVDEVDSILIDEARTPLIISGPLDDRSRLLQHHRRLHPEPRQDRLRGRREAAHRQPDRSRHGEDGAAGCATPNLLKSESLYDVENVSVVHHVNQALRAHKLFQRDKDYIVRNGEVVIIDEFTGRMMPGRRYSEGLHQALEAKEHQPIQPENQTLASITFQNYFRMYKKLAGMTGTALTEADEFLDIYNLEVLEVPTNMPLARSTRTTRSIAPTRRNTARSSRCSRSARSRASRCWSAPPRSRSPSSSPRCCARRAGSSTTSPTRTRSRRSTPATKAPRRPRCSRCSTRATTSRKPISCRQAGVPGAITIATNMAGRGTDIQLGGNADMRIRQELSDIEDYASACAIRAPTRSARRSRG